MLLQSKVKALSEALAAAQRDKEAEAARAQQLQGEADRMRADLSIFKAGADLAQKQNLTAALGANGSTTVPGAKVGRPWLPPKAAAAAAAESKGDGKAAGGGDAAAAAAAAAER